MPIAIDFRITIKPADGHQSVSDAILEDLGRKITALTDDVEYFDEEKNQDKSIISATLTSSVRSTLQGIQEILGKYVKAHPVVIWLTWFCNDLGREGMLEFTEDKIRWREFEFKSCNECGFPLQVNTDLSPTCDCLDCGEEKENDW